MEELHGGLELQPNDASEFSTFIHASEDPGPLTQYDFDSLALIYLQQPVSQLQGTKENVSIEPVYTSLFYALFWPSHPFLPSYKRIQEHLRESHGSNLSTTIAYIGSLYACAQSEHKNAQAVPNQLPEYPKNGYAVQSLILLAISSHMSNDPRKAHAILNNAIDIALTIGLHKEDFALMHGKGIHGIEESWRRTWWELYILDVMFAALNQRNDMRLKDVNSNVLLPCEENDYRNEDVGPYYVYPINSPSLLFL